MIEDPDYLLDLTQAILNTACDCLIDTPLGPPKDCFISQDKPADNCCDYLSIWVQSIYATRNFPDSFEGAVRCQDFQNAVSFGMELLRDCYPTLVDNPQSPFPPRTADTAAASDLLRDGQVLWCCLTNALLDGSAMPPDFLCNNVALGSMKPKRRGGCAGWILEFVVEIDACC